MNTVHLFDDLEHCFEKSHKKHSKCSSQFA